MKYLQGFVPKSFVILLLSIVTTSFAIAGPPPPPPIGTMAYSIASGIPTLSGTMLIVLSILLFVVALRVAKQKGAGKMFITLIGVSAITMGGSGIKLISEADALVAVPLPLPLDTSSTTGDVDVFEGLNTFQNNNSSTVTIQTLTTPGYICIDPTPSRPTTAAAAPPPIQVCGEGVRLPNMAECHITCFNGAVSDIRLKQDINYLSKLENGLNLYSFKYLPSFSSNNETYVGVMAQDLLKDSRYKNAVVSMKNDFYAVKYGDLGLKMITLEQWQQSTENIRYKPNQPH